MFFKRRLNPIVLTISPREFVFTRIQRIRTTAWCQWEPQLKSDRILTNVMHVEPTMCLLCALLPQKKATCSKRILKDFSAIRIFNNIHKHHSLEFIQYVLWPNWRSQETPRESRWVRHINLLSRMCSAATIPKRRPQSHWYLWIRATYNLHQESEPSYIWVDVCQFFRGLVNTLLEAAIFELGVRGLFAFVKGTQLTFTVHGCWNLHAGPKIYKTRIWCFKNPAAVGMW